MDLPTGSVTPRSNGKRSGVWQTWGRLSASERQQIGWLLVYIGALTLAFVRPLMTLLVHALNDSLDSHIPLVPLIAAYLLHARAPSAQPGRPSIRAALPLVALGITAVTMAVRWEGSVSNNDRLALMTGSYLSFVWAGGFLFLGSKWMAAAAFPVCFLVFMVPMPDALVFWLETGSVVASADVSALFFKWTGTPIVRDGTVFALPGIVIRVAQECSGIRSSWVLLITSLAAAYLFLRSPWRRLALVAFVVPLAIVRNAFRILTIGLLCVHVGPHMIDSVIHHRGGPLFFVLSLLPLTMFLLFLWKRESLTRRTSPDGFTPAIAAKAPRL